MPKLTLATTTLITAAFGLSSAALAQDTDWRTDTSVKVDHFSMADADVDGAINRAEFESYVTSRAEGGDSDYAMILSSGDFDLYFTEKDANANGVLSKDELTPVISESEPMITDDEDTIPE